MGGWLPIRVAAHNSFYCMLKFIDLDVRVNLILHIPGSLWTESVFDALDVAEPGRDPFAEPGLDPALELRTEPPLPGLPFAEVTLPCGEPF